ncbi:MAG: SRPBCC family protein [Bacteroidia bacterium]
METKPFVIERTFNAPVKNVWNAITDAGEMKQWYFDLPGFKAEAGYEFTFKGGKDPQWPFLHLCRVTEVVPGKKLSYSWRYEGFPGNSLVTFELFPLGEKTKLVLTHEGLESFLEANHPDLDPKNFVEGWTYIIGTSLSNYLAK